MHPRQQGCRTSGEGQRGLSFYKEVLGSKHSVSHLTDIHILAAELLHKDLVHSRSGRVVARNVKADREVACAEDPAQGSDGALMNTLRCVTNKSDVMLT